MHESNVRDYIHVTDHRPLVGMVLDGDASVDIRVLNELKVILKYGYMPYVLQPLPVSNPKAIPDKVKIVRWQLPAILMNFLFATANSLPLFNWMWCRKIKWFIDAYDIQLLHVHDLYMGGPGSRAAKRMKIPIIADLHEDFAEAIKSYAWVRKFPHRLFAFPERWAQKEKKILESVDGIIALSDHYVEGLKRKYPALHSHRMMVYPNVPDIQEMLSYDETPADFRKEGFCLLYFGMIGERRGLHTAAEAIRALRIEGIQCQLLIIGTVHKHEMAYFQKEVLLEGTVHIPWINISELRSYTAVCDACISPILKNPHHESGVANKIFQYMLYEKPLIVSDCAPQRAIVEKYGCGLWHASEDETGFTKAVKYLMQNPEECAAMGQRGKEAILRNLNTEVAGMAILQLYQELLGNAPTD